MRRTLRSKATAPGFYEPFKMDATITDILDALDSLDSRRMMPLLAIDPSGIGHIPKHNPEQLDAVALHERVRKLESG